MSIDAMKQAREFIESVHAGEWTGDFDRDQLVGSLTSAIEAAERQERVACTCADFVTNEIGYMKAFTNLPYNTDLYTAPQQPAIPDGWVLVKRSDLIAVSNKTLYSSCGVCRDVSFALETMLAAAPEVQK